MANPENNTKNADEEFDLSKEFYKTWVHPTFCALPAENVKTRPSYSSHQKVFYWTILKPFPEKNPHGAVMIWKCRVVWTLPVQRVPTIQQVPQSQTVWAIVPYFLKYSFNLQL